MTARYSWPNGITIIELVVALGLILGSVFYFCHSLSSSRKAALHVRDTVIAESYATELLEFLRSHTSDQLKQYLAVNPINPTFNPYFFCSHINILDRAADKLLNENPIATLPQVSSLPGSGNLRPNRYFQIQIVDIKSLAINKNRCANTAKEVYIFGRTPVLPGETIALQADERFLITVGVSWIPSDQSLQNVKRVVLTSLIPSS